ncbi:DUF3631 domain-containing protein [Streptomyces sp. NPDC102274]|uniref:DUF3631 domain-containing protein n=1 Tax=Streptomyces sp. NPDC102274 TaxID=3366151 RepID=UPI003805478E
MTTFPSLLDALTTTLLDSDPRPENPQHRALLDTYADVRALDRQLVAWAERHPSDDAGAADQLERLVDLLVERLAAGAELSRLLSMACCCADPEADNSAEDCDEHFGGDGDFLCCPGDCPPATIVHACLDMFATAGDPEAMASAELTDRLRHLPGLAEGRWAYAELTPLRLARLLAPYGARPRNSRFGEGQLKSYLRSSLVAALPDHSS